MQITKNLKTHIAYIRDWEEINLTTEQYQTLRLAKEDNKSRDMVTIKDPDTWKILFDWEYWDIKKFKERDAGNMGESRYICSYWTRHFMTDECKCSKRFWCTWFVFQDKLRELWHDTFYDSNITPAMQEEYLKANVRD